MEKQRLAPPRQPHATVRRNHLANQNELQLSSNRAGVARTASTQRFSIERNAERRDNATADRRVLLLLRQCAKLSCYQMEVVNLGRDLRDSQKAVVVYRNYLSH